MKKIMKLYRLTMLISALAIFGSIHPSLAGDGIKDDDISLRRSTVFNNPAVPLFESMAMTPGYNDLIPRAFQGAPPQVPHLVEKMLVNQKKNDCMECHTAKENEAGDPPISISHFTNDSGQTLSGRRHFCLTCHVVQFDAEPLVQNTHIKK